MVAQFWAAETGNSDNRNSLAKVVSVSTPFEYRDLSQGNLASIWQRLSSNSDSRYSYWLTRFVILRMLGLLYFVAFVSLARQVMPLIGSQGLLPVSLLSQPGREISRISLGCFRPGPQHFLGELF